MYRAKTRGGAQYVIYAPRMDEDVVGRLELVADLRRARIDQDFVLHYQPVVELETGTIVGVEALVRWPHATRGLLPPSTFIPLAEETGRIVEIGRWVLAEACRDAARWRAGLPGAEELSVSVNVSPRQMRRPGLLEDVRSALDESGLVPAALELEITESVVARRRDEMTSILNSVTALGVRLALDDFGTGYSSLSLLQDLPVQMLKIDRSFVSSLDAGLSVSRSSARSSTSRRPSASPSWPRESRTAPKPPRCSNWAVGSVKGSTSRLLWSGESSSCF